MKKWYLAGLAVVGLFTLSGQAHAGLVVSGVATIAGVGGNYKLIYDTDLDITWLDYTYFWRDEEPDNQNYVGRDGNMLWAADLVVTVNGASYDDWRLPSTVDESRLTRFTYDGTTSTGFNNPATSEMSHLFYTELGNTGNFTTNSGLKNKGPFLNLLSDSYYWSGTVNLLPSPSIQDNAWFFNMSNGYQGVTDKDASAGRGLAVTSGHIQGQMQPVPEPTTMLLFGTGLTSLAGIARRKKKVC